MTQFNQDQDEKRQQVQDLINLNKDPDLAIFKAIKAVGDKVGTMEQKVMEEKRSEDTIELEII